MGWAELREKKKQNMALLYGGEDPEKMRTDLTTFFGPRSEAYLAVWDKMRSGGSWAFSWSWPGFLLTFVWFFYRKMYAWGAVTILVPIVVGILYPSGSVGSLAAMGALGKGLYVNAGVNRIRKANQLGLTDKARTEYLTRAGGVSTVAGILAGILYACLLTVTILGAMHATRSVR
jgi:hypothetical protein